MDLNAIGTSENVDKIAFFYVSSKTEYVNIMNANEEISNVIFSTFQSRIAKNKVQYPN